MGLFPKLSQRFTNTTLAKMTNMKLHSSNPSDLPRTPHPVDKCYLHSPSTLLLIMKP